MTATRLDDARQPACGRIYLHTTSDRDRVVADALDRLIPADGIGHAMGTGGASEQGEPGVSKAENGP